MRIALCGSLQFIEQMHDVADKLRAMGHQVALPLSNEELNGVNPFTPEGRAFCNRESTKRIAASDAVLVVNEPKQGIAGYIGGNTLCEMAVAFSQDKTIYVMHALPGDDQLSYVVELRGMLPVILNNDLSKLKVAA